MNTPTHVAQAHGPLDGVRVIDLTQYMLGPYATQILGDLGAEVIKIEQPSGDRQRRGGRAPHSATMGPSFVSLNRNKKSVVLDLKEESGRASLRALLLGADVFIHNMRSESVARLGFSYASVAAIKHDIVYVEAMGYAPEGPYAGRQAFDDLIQAASGACGLGQLITPNVPLRPLPSYIADKTCGLFSVIATLAAVRHKERTGEGQYVAVPMLETFTGFLLAEHLAGETFVPPTGNFGYTTYITPNRRPHRTKDGHLAVAPSERSQSMRFMALGGIPDAFESERYTSKQGVEARLAEYYAMMDEAALAHSTAEWMELCAASGIPAMRVNTGTEIFDDPQLSQTLFELRQLEGEGTYRAMRPGFRFSKTPTSIHREAPPLGKDTASTLSAIASPCGQNG